ncbi:primosomal protein N' family DNA-binding protein [Persephonella sp.]
MNSSEENSSLYAEVALPVSQFMTFTYRVPDRFVTDVSVGSRVLVPFKGTKMTGIVVSLDDSTGLKKLKTVEELPDQQPVFTQEYINLLKKISDHYVAPIGITAYYAMPEGLRWKYSKKTGKWIKPAQEDRLYLPAVFSIPDNIPEKSKLLLEYLIEHSEATKKQLKKAGFSAKSIEYLLRRGLIKEETSTTENIQITTDLSETAYYKTLHKGIYLFNSLNCRNRLRKYVQIFSSNLKQGKSSILIFPSIQTVKAVYPYLKKVFKDRLFVYTDTVNEEEKIKIWFRLKSTNSSVVLGTYPAVFIPVKNLSTVAVEEEYSLSYKNQRTPRFDTRRVVFELFRLKKELSVIYGGSVLSTESYYLLSTGKGKPAFQGNIFSDSPQAEILFRKYKPEKIIDTEIIKLLEDKTKTALIVTNRKGFSSFLYCGRCEEELRCTRCDMPLKVHISSTGKFLQCEMCGKKSPYINTCTQCGIQLEEIGFGAEKILQMLKSRFYDDVSLLEDRKNRINITASLTGKGFYTDRYHYVINIYPDYHLYTDYRGEENFFRAVVYPYLKAQKKYFLITNQSPETPALKALSEKNPELFYRQELLNRKKLELPPFARLILLTFEKKNLSVEEVEKLFNLWKEKINTKITYEGPYFALISRAREKNRVQIMLKNFEKKDSLVELFNLSAKKGIKLIIDVDPKRII